MHKQNFVLPTATLLLLFAFTQEAASVFAQGFDMANIPKDKCLYLCRKNILMSNQDKKVNLELRKSRPQTLAAAFGGLLEMFGGRTSDADLINNWEKIVGTDTAKISNEFPATSTCANSTRFSRKTLSVR